MNYEYCRTSLVRILLPSENVQDTSEQALISVLSELKTDINFTYSREFLYWTCLLIGASDQNVSPILKSTLRDFLKTKGLVNMSKL